MKSLEPPEKREHGVKLGWITQGQCWYTWAAFHGQDHGTIGGRAFEMGEKILIFV